MSVRSGDIRQVTIDGREYDPKGDSGVDIILAGYNNDAAANGNGTAHITQKRVLGGFDGLALSIDEGNGDLEALQEIADNGEVVPVSMTLPSGISYQGSLIITGEIKKATAEGTATIAMRGETFEQV